MHARERAARVCHRCLRQKSVRVRTPLMYGYLTSCFVSTHVSRISARLGKVIATNPASLEAKAFHPQQRFVGHSSRGAHNNANNARATQSFSLLQPAYALVVEVLWHCFQVDDSVAPHQHNPHPWNKSSVSVSNKALSFFFSPFAHRFNWA